MTHRFGNWVVMGGPPQLEGIGSEGTLRENKNEINDKGANSLPRPKNSTKSETSAIDKKFGNFKVPFLAFLRPSADA